MPECCIASLSHLQQTPKRMCLKMKRASERLISWKKREWVANGSKEEAEKKEKQIGFLTEVLSMKYPAE